MNRLTGTQMYAKATWYQFAMKQLCSTCVFRVARADNGYCYANPPTVVYDGAEDQSWTIYPEANGPCGQWMPKKSEVEPKPDGKS